MENPRPSVGVDSLIHCGTHRRRIAVALQCATVHSWSEARRQEHPLLYKPFLMDPAATDQIAYSTYAKGNSAMGLCESCALEFWEGLGQAPLFIQQEAIAMDSTVLISVKLHLQTDDHFYKLMTLTNSIHTRNEVRLVCVTCITKHYFKPVRIDKYVERYE